MISSSPDPIAPLSIGIAIHDFSLGGTERVALRLAREWARRGAEVTLFCGAAAGPLADMAGDGVRVREAAPPIARGRGSRDRLGVAIAEMLASNPVDILFVPGNFHWPVIRHLRAGPDNRPAIVAQISAALCKPQRGIVKQWLFDRRMAFLLRGADAVVAMTEDARQRADHVMGGSRSVTIATPALDDDIPPPAPLSDGEPMVLAVGRLVPEKGFATLIAAFSRTGNRRAKLVILGSGPEEERLRALARQLGIADRVTLPGFVADSRPWLDRARLFVLSSWFEGFPAVLVEALAAGRPVVATDCTPATGLLFQHPGAGMTVPIRDADALAQAIDAMLAQEAPAPQALADLVEQHKIGSVAKQYLALFARLRAA